MLVENGPLQNVPSFLTGLGNELATGGRELDVERFRAVRSLMDTLEPKIERLCERRAARRATDAPDFNPFRYVARRENGVSDVIADLLKPDGDHGQGRSFLDCFLRVVGAPREICGARRLRANVWREFSTAAGRRIDIVLEIRTSKGTFWIGVENKPEADEEEDQVSDYLDYLAGECGERSSMVVFLAGRGQPVRSLSDRQQRELGAAGRFRYLTYSGAVLRWLSLCKRACRAKKVKWLLSAFAEYVEEQFGTAGA